MYPGMRARMATNGTAKASAKANRSLADGSKLFLDDRFSSL
jgi:hypothetical protein